MTKKQIKNDKIKKEGKYVYKNYYILLIALFAINSAIAGVQQEDIDNKIREFEEQQARSSKIAFCNARITEIKTLYQRIQSDVTELQKCNLAYMDNEQKTEMCRHDTAGTKALIDGMMSSLEKYSDSCSDTGSLRQKLSEQRTEVLRVLDLITKNYRVLDVKKFNEFQRVSSIEILRDVERLDCNIEIESMVILITMKYKLYLIRAFNSGDYHKMKQMLATILALKTRLGIISRKCNVDESDPRITLAYRRVDDHIRFFDESDPRILAGKACRLITPMNPDLEVVNLCGQGEISDYFFSTLSELLSRRP
ncbi:MAG: hypothetical protein HQK53_17025 [Oligoflexia bacterium]|nr:hypothetical protein [Oligoflexia bacterium]